MSEGIKRWYGGKDNSILASIIYNYLGKGKINHKISFVEFFEFIIDFYKPIKKNHNYVVFNLIAGGSKTIKILQLLKIFTKTPQGSPFGEELALIVDYYIQKSIKSKPLASQQQVYDITLFHKLIPYSSLAEELHHLFMVLPHQAFNDQGDHLPEEDAAMTDSCLWRNKSISKGKDQQEIRKYQNLFDL